jgi:hypothetical protein
MSPRPKRCSLWKDKTKATKLLFWDLELEICHCAQNSCWNLYFCSFVTKWKNADLILTVENTTIVCNPSISDQQGRNQKIQKVEPKMTTIIPKFRFCLKLTLLYCLLKEKKDMYFFEPNFGFMSGIQY